MGQEFPREVTKPVWDVTPGYDFDPDVDLKELFEIMIYESGNDKKNIIYILGLVNGIIIKNLMKYAYSSQIKNLIKTLIDMKFWENISLDFDYQ